MSNEIIEAAEDVVSHVGGAGKNTIIGSVLTLLMAIAAIMGYDVLGAGTLDEQIEAQVIKNTAKLTSHEAESCHEDQCDDTDTLFQSMERLSEQQAETLRSIENAVSVVENYAVTNTISIEMIRGELEENKIREIESQLREEKRDLEIEREGISMELARMADNDRKPTDTHVNRIRAINYRMLEITDELEMIVD